MKQKSASKLTPTAEPPVRSKFLVFGQPDLQEPEIQEVVETLRSGWIGTGPRVKQFEDNFAAYIGTKYAMGLNSCTAALHLTMIAAGVGPGDEVITTPLTFAATANAILHTGATPVFADIDPHTQNILPSAIQEKITERTKAILPVHMAGRPCEMDAILKIARAHNLHVIEDAAHAIEAEYHGQHVGTIGDAGCFSFYVTKNLVTGEGGMVTTNDEEWAEKIQTYGLHGLSKGAWKRFSDEGFVHYQVLHPGFKYNMTDMQAALGIHQLKRIELNARRRLEIWNQYDEAFTDLPTTLPAPEAPNTRHARHLYTLLLNLDQLSLNRDEIAQALGNEGIGTGIHYRALHLHPYYSERFNLVPDDFPAAASVSHRTLSIPLSSKLQDQDVEDVITAVRKVLLRYQR